MYKLNLNIFMEQQNFFQRNMKWIIVIGIIVILALWGVSKYNTFITQGEQIIAQWAQVENQYQRRFDLIPNIVNTVKGVAKQEQAVFGDITEARTRYSGATTADEKAKAATQVEGALGRLLVIAKIIRTCSPAKLTETLSYRLKERKTGFRLR